MNGIAQGSGKKSVKKPILTDKEREIIDSMRKLSDDNKKLVDNLIQALTDKPKDSK